MFVFYLGPTLVACASTAAGKIMSRNLNPIKTKITLSYSCLTSICLTFQKDLQTNKILKDFRLY